MLMPKAIASRATCYPITPWNGSQPSSAVEAKGKEAGSSRAVNYSAD